MLLINVTKGVKVNTEVHGCDTHFFLNIIYQWQTYILICFRYNLYYSTKYFIKKVKYLDLQCIYAQICKMLSCQTVTNFLYIYIVKKAKRKTTD